MADKLKQRIAFILPLVDGLNPNPAAIGISDYGYSILKYICPRHDVLVLSHSTSNKVTFGSLMIGDRSIKLIRCWKRDGPKSPFFIFSSLKSIVNILRQIAAHKSTLVHLEYDSSNAYGGTIGEPIIISLILVKLLLRKRITITTHCVWEDDDIKNYVLESTGSKMLSNVYCVYYRLALRMLFASVNSIITLTINPHSRATEVNKRYADINKVYEVIHGVPSEEKRVVLPTTKDNGFTALVFGSIRPGKDIETAILGFSEYLKLHNSSNARLLIAGSPSSGFNDNFASNYVVNLRSLCSKLGIQKHVFFDVRHISDNDVDALFRCSNVLLLLYKRRVGPSGVFARAISCDLPTIMNIDDKYVGKTGSIPAVLVGKLGQNTAKEVAEAINKLNNDLFLKNLYSEMNDYKYMYSFQKTAENYNKIFLVTVEKSTNRRFLCS